MAPLRGVKPVHPDDWKAKGPAEAATSPSRGPKQSEGSAMNRNDSSTAASRVASESVRRTAFHGLDIEIKRVLSFTSLSHYLVGLLDQQRRQNPTAAPDEALVDHLFFISSEAEASVVDLDGYVLANHNAASAVAQ